MASSQPQAVGPAQRKINRWKEDVLEGNCLLFRSLIQLPLPVAHAGGALSADRPGAKEENLEGSVHFFHCLEGLKALRERLQ